MARSPTADRVVHFRLDLELLHALDTFVARQNAQVGQEVFTRSTAARHLMRMALETPPLRAITSEVMTSMRGAQKLAAVRINKIIEENLPGILAEELRRGA